MKCQSIKKNVKKICTSDFDKRIKILTTAIIPNNAPNSSATVGFTTIATVWAMVKTNTAREFIDGVNIEKGINTDFYVRYNSSIPLDKQLWIEYQNIYYKIVNTDNIDIDEGDKTINANKR
jgi:SPP1 family predicted phage head-tail adaptor